MGLLRCRGCGEVVSSLVLKCPSCGQPMPPPARSKSILERWNGWLDGLHALTQMHLADRPPPRRR